ncbi:MAG: choice-of-anchor X domain-containing protein [Candidatus Margulisiibacteriota bacterium]
MLAPLVLLSYGCGTQTQTQTEDAITTALDNDAIFFGLGSSDPENPAFSISTFSTTLETPALRWWRTFTPGTRTSAALSNDGVTAIVKVTRGITEGILNLKMTLTEPRYQKYFNQSGAWYVELASSNGGITWSIDKITTGVSTSLDYTPASGVGSVASTIVINEIKVVDKTTGTTLYAITQEASASGPWINRADIPAVSKGDSLEVTVTASDSSSNFTPFVYVWPGNSGMDYIFRRMQHDDGTHGDTVAGDGIFVNTAQPITVPADEPTGIKVMHVGIFSSGTLAGTTEAYDFRSMHIPYKVL